VVKSCSYQDGNGSIIDRDVAQPFLQATPIAEPLRRKNDGKEPIMLARATETSLFNGNSWITINKSGEEQVCWSFLSCNAPREQESPVVNGLGLKV
jgi:hypothetical protein